MRTIALTAALIAATVSTAAIAADWVIVAESDAGDVFTVDSTSIRTMPNGYKRAWEMQFYAAPLTGTGSPNRAVILSEYDCSDVKSRTIQSTYFKDDQALETNNAPTPWVYASPGSLHEAQLNYVCFGKLPE